jgi:A/G-specific adenine glycosylase
MSARSFLMKPKEIKRFQEQLIGWYQKHHRKLPWRETGDPYRIWVSEVMLQQTQTNTVLPYYRKFFIRFPNLTLLAESDLQDLLKVWEGLGYYARARHLHRAANIILAEYGGNVPDTWEAIRKLPGVGDYIGAAVLSIAFNKPYAVVDGNVKRLLARLFEVDAPVNKSSSYRLFKEKADSLLFHCKPGVFNQAMMELGAMVCKPGQPVCGICPLIFHCQAYQKKSISEYPQRTRRPPSPVHHIAVGVVCKNNHMLITQRKSEGLLGGLWEFPGGRVKKNESPESACIREIKEEVNLKVQIDAYITRVKHAYTHFKIIMDVFTCRYLSCKVKLDGPVDYRWITPPEIDQYPFPKANHKFFPLLWPHIQKLKKKR